MITQVKTFLLSDPINFEVVVNEWLKTEPDIEVHQIYPMPLMVQRTEKEEAKPVLMIILTYTKEGWR